MLGPRYTEGDKVQYCIADTMYVDTAVIIRGPIRNGIWWEYLLSNNSRVKDHEIRYLVGRED